MPSFDKDSATSSRRESGSPRRILAVKTHALGDVLMATPAVHRLRELYPGAHLAFLTTHGAAPLLENNSDIDEVIAFDGSMLFGSAKWKLVSLAGLLRKQRFNRAYCFQASKPLHGLLRLAGITEINGLHSGGWNPFLTAPVPWKPRERVSAALKFWRVIGEEPTPDPACLLPRFFPTEDERAKAREVCTSLGIGGQGAVGIFPGGGANMRDTVLAKRWPVERFREVIRHIAAGHPILLLGGPGDEAVIDALVREAPDRVTVAPRLALREFCALIGELRLLLTNDSLPLHVAMAQAVPTIALFGPSDAQALIPAVPTVTTLQAKLRCAPCYANEPFPGCALGTPECMETIEAGQVVAAVRTALEGRRKKDHR